MKGTRTAAVHGATVAGGTPGGGTSGTAARRLVLRIAAVAALLVGVLGGIAVITTAAPTDAAWTDTSYSTATLTAGTWTTTSANSCVAYSTTGAVLSGCTVRGIDYVGWGEQGSQTRNYYVHFGTPAGTHHVTFSVDLTTATGDGGHWSWKRAQTGAPSQFTPTGGWTCEQLPRLTGRAADWHTDIYLPIYEKKTDLPVTCS